MVSQSESVSVSVSYPKKLLARGLRTAGVVLGGSLSILKSSSSCWYVGLKALLTTGRWSAGGIGAPAGGSSRINPEIKWRLCAKAVETENPPLSGAKTCDG